MRAPPEGEVMVRIKGKGRNVTVSTDAVMSAGKAVFSISVVPTGIGMEACKRSMGALLLFEYVVLYSMTSPGLASLAGFLTVLSSTTLTMLAVSTELTTAVWADTLRQTSNPAKKNAE